MKYEEIVKKVKTAANKLDVAKIAGHVAMQIDIEGVGEGAFYVDAADGKVSVEPYEYYDRDCKLRADADTIIALFTGKLELSEALSSGNAVIEGDVEKAKMIANAVKKPATRKAATTKKATTTKKETATKKETTTKKAATTAKKASAEKKSAPAKKTTVAKKKTSEK